MAARRRQADLRRRALAIAASVVVHALLLAIFVLSVRSWPSLSERPVLTVQLAPLLHARAPAQRRRERKLPPTASSPRAALSEPEAPAPIEAP